MVTSVGNRQGAEGDDRAHNWLYSADVEGSGVSLTHSDLASHSGSKDDVLPVYRYRAPTRKKCFNGSSLHTGYQSPRKFPSRSGFGNMSRSSGRICIGSATDPLRLPGDPSLLLHTSVVLTPDQKASFMSAASKSIASCLGKPESYVAVCVVDGASLIFGGSDAPSAIGCVYSLGSINKAPGRWCV